ncbi:hypothetical protein LINPERHAP1_LOCUS18382 [Linum perenne]
MQRYESFENPMATAESSSFGSHDEERRSSRNPQLGTALYDFTAGGDDEGQTRKVLNSPYPKPPRQNDIARTNDPQTLHPFGTEHTN